MLYSSVCTSYNKCASKQHESTDEWTLYLSLCAGYSSLGCIQVLLQLSGEALSSIQLQQHILKGSLTGLQCSLGICQPSLVHSHCQLRTEAGSRCQVSPFVPGFLLDRKRAELHWTKQQKPINGIPTAGLTILLNVNNIQQNGKSC